MTQMKGKSKEYQNNESKEDKNVEVELAYKNEKMLRKRAQKIRKTFGKSKLKC